MNVTLTEREVRALSRLREKMARCSASRAELGAGATPPRRPSLVLVEGSAKRRTKPCGQLRVIRE